MNRRRSMLREVRAVLGAHGVIDLKLAGALCALIRKYVAAAKEAPDDQEEEIQRP